MTREQDLRLLRVLNNVRAARDIALYSRPQPGMDQIYSRLLRAERQLERVYNHVRARGRVRTTPVRVHEVRLPNHNNDDR